MTGDACVLYLKKSEGALCTAEGFLHTENQLTLTEEGAPPTAHSQRAARTTDSQVPDDLKHHDFMSSSKACKKILPNMDSFFSHTTPCLPILHGSRESCSDGHQSFPFFKLQDLWDSYEEWSAYGAEVPLVMESSEEVLQYYVPYLSAMQLFRKNTSCKDRCISSDSSSEVDSDSTDEDSSDNLSSRCTDITCDVDSLESVSEDGDRVSRHRSDEKHAGAGPGNSAHLMFEYFESAAPYTRSPLADKVAELSRCLPELVSLRSCDLDASSWLAVAWYPIYRIPTGRTLRDLSACFLTYHALDLRQQDKESASVRGCPTPQPDPSSAVGAVLAGRCAGRAAALEKSVKSASVEGRVGGVEVHSLKPFGFAAYKLRGDVWSAPGGSAKAHEAMHSNARCWLSQRNIVHPDFEFFANR